MVLGFGALASLGLALPTGMAFGYGYGYGVRAGYSAFKKPSDEVNKLKLSADPVKGALGAGLQSAEERTGAQIKKVPNLDLSNEQSASSDVEKIMTPKQERRFVGKGGWTMTKSQMYQKALSHGISDKREVFRRFMKGEYPFNRSSGNVRSRSPTKYVR